MPPPSPHHPPHHTTHHPCPTNPTHHPSNHPPPCTLTVYRNLVTITLAIQPEIAWQMLGHPKEFAWQKLGSAIVYNFRLLHEVQSVLIAVDVQDRLVEPRCESKIKHDMIQTYVECSSLYCLTPVRHCRKIVEFAGSLTLVRHPASLTFGLWPWGLT